MEAGRAFACLAKIVITVKNIVIIYDAPNQVASFSYPASADRLSAEGKKLFLPLFRYAAHHTPPGTCYEYKGAYGTLRLMRGGGEGVKYLMSVEAHGPGE